MIFKLALGRLDRVDLPKILVKSSKSHYRVWREIARISTYRIKPYSQNFIISIVSKFWPVDFLRKNLHFEIFDIFQKFTKNFGKFTKFFGKSMVAGNRWFGVPGCPPTIDKLHRVGARHASRRLG